MFVWVGINVENQLKETRRAVDGVFENIEISNVTCQLPLHISLKISFNIENEVFENVLNDIIDTPISPELKPNQTTEASVGKYEINDFILYRYLFCGDSNERAAWLLSIAFEMDYKEAISYVNNFTRRFYTQQFKRSALPEGPKVLKMSLSPRSGFKIPSDLSRR